MTLFADVGDIKLIDMADMRFTKTICSQDLLVMLARLPLGYPAVSNWGFEWCLCQYWLCPYCTPQRGVTDRSCLGWQADQLGCSSSYCCVPLHVPLREVSAVRLEGRVSGYAVLVAHSFCH